MFINYFKSSFFSQYLAIFLSGLILWTGSFFNPAEMPLPGTQAPFYRFLYNFLAGHQTIAVILGFLVVNFETYFLNYILNRHELIPKNSSLAALVFLVMMSSSAAFLILNPVNISLVFILFVLHHLLIYYNKPDHLDRVYIAGFFITLASLFYFPMTIWFVFVLVSLIICRAANWRAWLAVIAGFVTPYLYVMAYLFWNDSLAETLNAFLLYCSNIRITAVALPQGLLIPVICSSLIFLWTLIIPMKDSDKAVETRAKMNVVTWTLIFAILSLPLSGSHLIYHGMLAIPLISVIIARKIQGMKKKRYMEFALLLYFFSLFGNNLFFALKTMLNF